MYFSIPLHVFNILYQLYYLLTDWLLTTDLYYDDYRDLFVSITCSGCARSQPPAGQVQAPTSFPLQVVWGLRRYVTLPSLCIIPPSSSTPHPDNVRGTTIPSAGTHSDFTEGFFFERPSSWSFKQFLSVWTLPVGCCSVLWCYFWRMWSETGGHTTFHLDLWPCLFWEMSSPELTSNLWRGWGEP